MTLFDFLVLSLATWRITHIVVHEDGPWDLMRRMRKNCFAGEFDSIEPSFDKFTDAEMEWWLAMPEFPKEQGFFGKLLSCPLCASVWVGACIGWIAFFMPVTMLFVSIPFALSAASIVVGRLYDFLEKTDGAS